VIAGKYGVGLLGFWAIGEDFELRSRVAASNVLALKLREDADGGEIVRVPLRIGAPTTFTEVVVSAVHETALRTLGGARLASYLGSELRGQLLNKEISLSIHDGMARGLAQQDFEVRPRRYLGVPLAVPLELSVPGSAPARIELHLALGPDDAVQLACAGSVVADHFGELAVLGLAEPPWVGGGLTGVIDFPDLNVPPGTRRGVIPDEVAHRFASVLKTVLAPLVQGEIDRLERERRTAAQRDVARDLRKALRGLVRRLPQYELPGARSAEGAVKAPEEGPSQEGPATPPDDGAEGAEPEQNSLPPEPGEGPELELFPPGPLASATLVPQAVDVPIGGERRVHVVALDGEGRKIRRELDVEWVIDGATCFELRGAGRRPAIAAKQDASAGTTGRVLVRLAESGHTALASASITAVAAPEREAATIPDPDFVDDPKGGWRSRMVGARWQVNEAHEDFLALRSEPKARLRYLLELFAKELVNRSFGMPGSEELLERMVEVLAHAERNLRGE
jgi:hypothetical protein